MYDLGWTHRLLSRPRWEALEALRQRHRVLEESFFEVQSATQHAVVALGAGDMQADAARQELNRLQERHRTLWHSLLELRAELPPDPEYYAANRLRRTTFPDDDVATRDDEGIQQQLGQFQQQIEQEFRHLEDFLVDLFCIHVRMEEEATRQRLLQSATIALRTNFLCEGITTLDPTTFKNEEMECPICHEVEYEDGPSETLPIESAATPQEIAAASDENPGGLQHVV
ncbi:hypothetical protein BDV96DRAFT_603974 [Lophiotrema nucula]|uniref:Uncharacterized protein n=1 Tax=Lophiotrema nucula TaxID=690887 RepID=A0A6A5YW87_9PLEO|nr:hypothetical protein BDV96DRAFT_603974 [Lophiotrema nucula]